METEENSKRKDTNNAPRINESTIFTTISRKAIPIKPNELKHIKDQLASQQAMTITEEINSKMERIDTGDHE